MSSSRPSSCRVLILGGTGMLGHKLWQLCCDRFETSVTVHHRELSGAAAAVLDSTRTVCGVSAQELETVRRAFETTQPDVVVNCIGIIKQRAEAKEALISIAVNSMFPHQLARLCSVDGVRLVHVSTDCVFSGKKGFYSEADPPDPVDLYGRSKLLGEVEDSGCLTLRTSMIGRELGTSRGLVEWFLGQRGGSAPGFTRAMFSGLTTQTLATLIADLIEHHRDLEGLWHVAADAISKFDLLALIRDALHLDINLIRDDGFALDRTLDDSRFRSMINWKPPAWSAMVEQLAGDETPYRDFHNRALLM